MYVPRHFKPSSSALLREAISAHPLALLLPLARAGAGAGDAQRAVHLPLLFRETEVETETRRSFLVGHIARANPLANLLQQQQQGQGKGQEAMQCLAIFRGPDAYVSPSWYTTKQETGKVVPTWNYVAVHVSGKVRIVEQREWVLQVVSDLTDKHEAAVGSQWRVGDAPASYVDSLLRAIVGIEIEIDSIDGQFKLSQNKNDGDFAGVVNGLKSTGKGSDRLVAELMERERSLPN